MQLSIEVIFSNGRDAITCTEPAHQEPGMRRGRGTGVMRDTRCKCFHRVPGAISTGSTAQAFAWVSFLPSHLPPLSRGEADQWRSPGQCCVDPNIILGNGRAGRKRIDNPERFQHFGNSLGQSSKCLEHPSQGNEGSLRRIHVGIAFEHVAAEVGRY